MNNPVLLPKRKDYGFLKAPPTLKGLNIFSSNSLTPTQLQASPPPPPPNHSHTHSSLPSYMRLRLTTSGLNHKKADYIAYTSKPLNHLISHKLDNIQIKYELKSSHPVAPQIASKTAATSPPNVQPEALLRSATLQNIDFKREHLKRQAYSIETGTNFGNLQRQHSLLCFPARNSPFIKNHTSTHLGLSHFEILTGQLKTNNLSASSSASLVDANEREKKPTPRHV